MNDWQRCVAFHGHECGGLTIGFKAAQYAAELLSLTHSSDEEVVCICENDACGVDAIQVLLGCSIGKGNLLFHMTGKSAYSFYDRKTGRSLRLVQKPKPAGISREDSFRYYQECAPADMFEVKPATRPLPSHASIFKTYPCDCCGEYTATNWLRLEGDRKLCPDCFQSYNRFDV